MRTKLEIHLTEYKHTLVERCHNRAQWSARAGLWAMTLGLVFLAGCGVIGRAERTATRTAPPITEAAPTTPETAPTVTQVGPTRIHTPVSQGVTPAPPSPTPTPVSRSVTPTPTAGASSGPIVPSAGIALGIYQPQTNTTGDNIDAYIREAGRKPAFAWLPMTWERPDGSYWQFDSQMLDEFRTRGILPGLTWNPSKGPVEAFTNRQAGINQAAFSWKEIAAGKHDAYITAFAKAAAAYQYPFILRFLHEVDGTWYPWGYSVNGNSNPADYVSAWKHIVDIFRKENATNVQFVWNPSALSPDLIQKYGATLKQLYPGDEYVDWLGLDGYSNAQNGWRSLQDEFQPTYDFITSFSARPVILFEVGAAANPSDAKAQANWITEGFLKTIPTLLPKVKGAAWFNSRDGSGRDYRLQNSPSAGAAWKQVIASPLYQGSLTK